MSLTSVVGPLIMANVFAFFTGPKAPVHLPGAAMLLGSGLVLVAAGLARTSLKRTVASRG